MDCTDAEKGKHMHSTAQSLYLLDLQAVFAQFHFSLADALCLLMQYHAYTTKCATRISYPAALDMAPFCTKDVLSTGYKTTFYSLTAAIIHRGGGNGGHYTCFTKVAPGEYLYRDDAHAVQRISEATALGYTGEVHGLLYTVMPTRYACLPYLSQYSPDWRSLLVSCTSPDCTGCFCVQQRVFMTVMTFMTSNNLLLSLTSAPCFCGW